jgi:hypothetical protein
MDYEFYETPDVYTRWLFSYMAHRGTPIVGRLFEPCVGNRAIIRAAALRPLEFGVTNEWVTNDLDPRWPADMHADATDESIWRGLAIDWTVSNPAFTPALAIIDHALKTSRVGVAMHLRLSIHEVLKKKDGPRRTWMHDHPPTGILFLPRFAYQRSKKTGKWSQDTVSACWCVWLTPDARGRARQFIDYAPESVVDELIAETKAYRQRMDLLMAAQPAAEPGQPFVAWRTDDLDD